MAGEEEEIEDQPEEGGDAIAPSAASGLSKIVKILIYVALGAVGLLIMMVIAYYVALFAAAQQYKEVSSIAIITPPPPTDSFRFPDDFRVNTADQGESHFIKLRMSLGFEKNNPALKQELTDRMSQLRDIVNLILAGKTKDQLSTIQEQLELREEIKASINHILSDGKITNIYFDEFIVN